MLQMPPPNTGISSMGQQIPQILSAQQQRPTNNTLGGFATGGMPVGNQMQGTMQGGGIMALLKALMSKGMK